ncbi:MAG: GNAT family N-acetyltransferase [Candidatus Velamenicoccus archaeovorus]
MTIDVRPVRPDEMEEAGRVTALAYREFATPGDPDWDTYLSRIADVGERHGRTCVLVAVEAGRVFGSVTLELDGRTEPDEEDRPLAPDEAHVRMLGVHPEHRRRGIARRLMDACMDEARKAGRTRLTLNTTQRMQAAQRMYEALGFRRTPDRVFPDGFVLLGYERRI